MESERNGGNSHRIGMRMKLDLFSQNGMGMKSIGCPSNCLFSDRKVMSRTRAESNRRQMQHVLVDVIEHRSKPHHHRHSIPYISEVLKAAVGASVKFFGPQTA